MKKNKIKEILVKLVRVSVIAYLAFGAFLFFNQKNILYHPDNTDFKSCSGFVDYEKKEYKGTRFYFKQQSKKDILVYYHGNMGSACYRSYKKERFEKMGVSIIFVEYTGYSNDNEDPSNKTILKDVNNVNDFINKKSFENVIVYGHSLGGAAASYHASLGNVDKLILVSTFSTLMDVSKGKFSIYPVSYLLKEEYNNIERIKDFNGAVLIVHGKNDSVIPYNFSYKLYKNIDTKNKYYMLVDKTGHNDVWFDFKFEKKLVDFISDIE